jgi:hypothetical protein
VDDADAEVVIVAVVLVLTVIEAVDEELLPVAEEGAIEVLMCESSRSEAWKKLPLPSAASVHPSLSPFPLTAFARIKLEWLALETSISVSKPVLITGAEILVQVGASAVSAVYKICVNG